MDRSDIQDFLTSRRARLTPEQAGLASYGGQRRVKGLRREEVATLTGVSVDYYARLERGQLSGASDSVLEALSRALQLDEAERQHLRDLARSCGSAPASAPRRPKTSGAPRPAVRRLLDGMTGLPAYVRNNHGDVLAANELCRALYGGVLDEDRLPVNLARYLFLEPHARGFFLDWEQVADDMAGALRVEAGRHPQDRALSNLIGELTTRSDSFAGRWARQNVQLHRTSRKRLHNAVVGDIELTGDALELAGDGLTIIAYTADPGSPAEDQLQLLSAWNADRSPRSAPSVRADDRRRHDLPAEPRRPR